ncbi:MAG: SDR family NAD(P)-dependent oxidoreductase [Alcanivoracaceae bacterium]
MTLKGKRILITGGSSGLGLALATRLAGHNQVALVARNADKLRQAEDSIRKQVPGAVVKGYAIDVTGPHAAEALSAIATEMNGLDVLINSAGILREGYFDSLELSVFRETMEINLFGTINAIQALLPFLEKSRGRILNVASIAGMTGVFGYAAYCSSKFALVGLTETLRYELGPRGIIV